MAGIRSTGPRPDGISLVARLVAQGRACDHTHTVTNCYVKYAMTYGRVSGKDQSRKWSRVRLVASGRTHGRTIGRMCDSRAAASCDRRATPNSPSSILLGATSRKRIEKDD